MSKLGALSRLVEAAERYLDTVDDEPASYYESAVERWREQRDTARANLEEAITVAHEELDR